MTEVGVLEWTIRLHFFMTLTSMTFLVATVPATRATIFTTDQDGGGDLDLFVMEQFIKFDQGEHLENTTLECRRCDGNGAEENGCVVRLSTMVPTECDYLYPHFRSITYDPVTNTACLAQYQDEKCTIPSDDSSTVSSCAEEWNLGDGCIEGGASSNNGEHNYNQVVNRLPKWCIRSSQPRDEFQYPMIRLTTYETVADCQSKSIAKLDRSILITAENACSREPVDATDFTIIAGGARAYCDKSNTLRTSLFSNQDCTSQTIPKPPLFPTINFTSQCSNPLLPYGYEGLQGRTANCDAPQIYCLGIAGKVRYVLSPSGSDSSTPTPPPRLGFSPSRSRDSDTTRLTSALTICSFVIMLW